jgi:hypothetical protein
MCVGQLSLIPYLSFEEEEKDHYHSQGIMVGRNMERLGELVGKACCTWCCIMENARRLCEIKCIISFCLYWLLGR